MKTRFTRLTLKSRLWSLNSIAALACLFMLWSAKTKVSAQSEPAPFQRIPNPAAAGLWIGEITLRHVTYPPTGALVPAQGEAQMRIILHVDTTGKVRLLKDAIIAAKSGTVNEQLVLTKALLLAELPVQRSAPFNAAAAQRFSTVAFDFTDNDSNPADAALELEGGLGQNFECGGPVVLDKAHPTNPFRHKFHPDHANEGTKAYNITRVLKLQSIAGIQNIGGVDQLPATYEETISGLNRAPLTIQGTVNLTRVSTASTLNQ